MSYISDNLKDFQKVADYIEKKKPNLHKYVSTIIFIITTLCALYMGGWLLAARSVIKFVVALMAGTVTVGLTLLTIFHIVMAVFVIAILFFAGVIVSDVIHTLLTWNDDDKVDEDDEK